MANVVLLVLSLTIGIFFILIGTIKLSPILSEEVYREMRKIFIRHARVVPFARVIGMYNNPHLLRKIVGTNEVVCGAVLAMIPGPLKQVANVLLLVNVVGAVYTHWQLKDPLDKMTPALVFGLLLACRLVVHLQVSARERRAAAAAATDKTKEE